MTVAKRERRQKTRRVYYTLAGIRPARARADALAAAITTSTEPITASLTAAVE